VDMRNKESERAYRLGASMFPPNAPTDIESKEIRTVGKDCQD
jgi:hypothetical protein